MKHRILTGLLTAALLLAGLPSALHAHAKDLDWSVDGCVLTIRGNGPMEDFDPYLNIPDTAPWITYADVIEHVVIEEGVTYIGERAFDGCRHVADVTVPESVTGVGENAFAGTAWWDAQPDGVVYAGSVAYRYKGTCTGEVTLRPGTAQIAPYCFSGQRGLTGITLPEGVTGIGLRAFEGCTGLPEVSLPAGLLCIGDSAFENCTSLVSVTLPAGLSDIGAFAFEGCTSLPEVSLPAGVCIGSYAFRDCTALSEITFPEEGVSIGPNDVFAGTAWWGSQPDGLVYAGSVAYRYKGTCEGEITLRPGTTRIESYCFNWQSGLTGITIPESVTQIGDSAFENCTGLTAVTLPEGVTGIGEYAFYRCTDLAQLSIPESVTGVGENAFTGTAWWDAQPDGVIYAGSVAYQYRGTCEGGVTLRPGTAQIAPGCFKMQRGMTDITLPEGLTCIGEQAFQGCTGLTAVTLPKSLTALGNYAFAGCGLTSITLPENVTVIGDLAFQSCTDLTQILVSAGNSAYQSVDGLLYTGDGRALVLCPQGVQGEVTLPEGVERIGRIAGCTGLTGITIPSGVTHSLSYKNFAGCTSLTQIRVSARNPVYMSADGMLCTRDGRELLCCPEGLQGEVTVPEGVASVGESVFYGRKGLTSVVLPESVTRIGRDAFAACPDLASVTVRSPVCRICENPNGGRSVYNSIGPSYYNGFAYVQDCTYSGVICGFAGSTAQAYADACGYAFRSLGSFPCTAGDVDLSGDTGVIDAVLLQRHLTRRTTLTAAQLSAADLNADGRVDVLDLTLLKQTLTH